MIKMASTAAEMIVTRSERKVEDDDDDDGCMHGWMDVGREGGRDGWLMITD